MWEVRFKGQLIARGGSLSDIKNGRNFFTEPDEYLQWAAYRIDTERDIADHVHIRRNRQGKFPTHEFFIVVSGQLEVKIFAADNTLLDYKALKAGDFYCQYAGGHGFHVLANTLFFEVKHGPFCGSDKDKILVGGSSGN